MNWDRISLICRTPNKAVAYYEKAVELDKDSVRMSNNIEWLVHHYFEDRRTSPKPGNWRIARPRFTRAGD